MQNNLFIYPIPALSDNYIWLLGQQRSRQCIIVDPSAPQPVIDYCTINNWQPSAIWITHHHNDHTGGMLQLAQKYNIPIYGPEQSKPTYDVSVNDNEIIELIDIEVRVLAIPGHTKDHIAYYTAGVLCCGDTLFSAGCGRAFECPTNVLYASLLRLKNLPPETLILPAHEYTLDNLKFAATIEPNNTYIQQRIEQVYTMRQQGQASLPSTLAIEAHSNPFLRCDQAPVIEYAEHIAGHKLSEEQVFTQIRQLKDNWNPKSYGSGV